MRDTFLLPSAPLLLPQLLEDDGHWGSLEEALGVRTHIPTPSHQLPPEESSFLPSCACELFQGQAGSSGPGQAS